MKAGPDTSEAAAAWMVAAASVIGQTHQRIGLPCQDAHAWTCLPDGTLVAAVADGTGSAAHAEIGSATAVRAAVDAAQLAVLPAWSGKQNTSVEDADERRQIESLAQLTYGDFLFKVVMAVNAAITNKAAELSVPSHSLATTLVLLARA